MFPPRGRPLASQTTRSLGPLPPKGVRVKGEHESSLLNGYCRRQRVESKDTRQVT